MAVTTVNHQSRKAERIFLLLISLVLAVLFVVLFFAQQQNFKEVHARLTDGTMVNLNDQAPGKHIRTLLTKGYYFDDKKDVDLIEKVINQSTALHGTPIDNIGELNKRNFFVSADQAYTFGGKLAIEQSPDITACSTQGISRYFL